MDRCVIRGAMALTVGSALCIGANQGWAAEFSSRKPMPPATAVPPMPARELALYREHIVRLQPVVRRWIERQAQAERERPGLDVSELSAAIRARFDSPQPPGAEGMRAAPLSGSNVAALAVLVILQMV